MFRLENISIKKLRIFVEMAEGRDPVETLGTPYRSKCRCVQELEAGLGYKLFDGMRTASNLTPKGVQLALSAKKIVAEVNRFYNITIPFKEKNIGKTS